MSHSAEHPAFIAAGNAFAKRLKALQTIADVNRASVMACLDPEAGFVHSDPEDAALVASSVVYGIASIRLLLQAANIAAYDLEDAAALAEAERVS